MKILLLFLTVTVFTNGADINDLVDGNVKLSGALYANVRKQQNIVSPLLLGPFSTETVMALTQSGAKGATAEELRSGIFLPKKSEDIDAAMMSALSTIPANISTKMFSVSAYDITDDFKETESTIYQGSVENMEFQNTTAAATNLNNWVNADIASALPNSFSSSDFSRTTQGVLINKLSLKPEWANPFPPQQTYTTTYTYYDTQNASHAVNRPMMTQELLSYNYYESAKLDARFLEIPFQNPNLTFTIVLPNAWNGLQQLEQQIDEVLAPPNYVKRIVQLSLVRDYVNAQHTSLANPMKTLGVQTPFTSSADLSGMAGIPGDVVVNNVLHSSSLTFHEKGINAAVDAAVTTQLSTHHSFVVNHPFLFYVKYNGVIILLGRYIS